MSRAGRAAAWLRAQANGAASWSLFWLFTIAAIALASIGLIVGFAIWKGIDAATAGMIGTAIALLGQAADRVVRVIGVLLGAPPGTAEPEA